VYAQEIKSLLLDTENVDLASHYKNVVGIEKEYRLSKVSKVSAFMYGQDDIKVIYADALAENPEIKENEYSILVANPPYSVKGFLETLSETDRNKFQLINSVDVKSYPNNNSIETFFIEKAKQLLKPGGVAGIIVPSSILSRGKAKSTSKSKNIYVTSREILLKYFDIIAITEFGSGTFGKTGTGTVTLFLRRKNENPSPSEHYLNRIESWFNGSHQMDEVFEDKNLVEDYCERIGVDFLNYLTLLNGSVNNDLLESDVFKTYITEFEKSNERKDLRKKHANQINGIEKSVISSITKLLKEKGKTRSKETARAIGLRVLEKRKRILVSEQKHETNQLFHKYLVKNEKEKLLFFIMAKLNPQNVLIVRSPSKNTEMKNFLGYEWSSAKGREGIKYMGGIPFDDVKEISEEDDDIVAELEDDDKRVLSNILNLNNISTPLYDPKNKFNTRKINYLIEKNFKREEFEIPEELSDLVTELQLTEMIDFNNVDFNKAINLIQKNKIKIDTKWDLVKLGSVADVKNGGTPDTNNPSYWNGSICWATLADTKQKYLEDTKKKITPLGLSNSNAVLLPVNTVIFSSRATIGEVTINKIETCTNQGYKNFVCDPLQLNYEYLYYILVRYKEEIEKIIPPGTKYKEINSHDIKNFHIPLPPLFEQEKLVKKLLKFEKEKNKLFKTGMTIDEFEELANLNRQKIIDTFIK
jgi:type I restriction-modification system DNA methylase subunit